MASKPQLKVLMDLSDGLEVNETSALCFDISDIVITANTRRGRNREIDKIQAGYCVITVIDDNGDFNPDNTASPYYGKLVPGKKLRLYPLYDDGTGEFRYPDIFTGYITNYRTDFSIGVDAANKIVIEAYDGMKIFNSVSITEVTNATSGDFSDERIEAILDEITWPTGLTLLETSTIELDADQGELRTVLDALRQVEDTEAGLLYFDGSGVFQFKNRATVATTPTFDAANAFSDAGQYIGYNDIGLIQDDATLLNEITVVSYNGSNEATASNATSATTYFKRSAERRNVLLSATTDLQDLADTLLANYQDPSLQIDRIVLNLAEYEAVDRLVAAFYFDIFFIPIYVEKKMPGDTLISRIGWIQGLNHDITKNTWMVTAFTGLTSLYENIPNWLTAMYLPDPQIAYAALTDTAEYPSNMTVLDSNQNIIVKVHFGTSEQSLDRQQVFVKLDKFGQVLQRTMRTDIDYSWGGQIWSDGNDGFYFVNETEIARLDNDIALVWQKKLNETIAASHIVKDSSNNAYVLFIKQNTYPERYTAGIVKFSTTGTTLIEKELYTTTASWDDDPTTDEPEDLKYAVSVGDKIYGIYTFFEDGSFQKTYAELVEFNTSCEIVSQYRIEYSSSMLDINTFAVDDSYNKYIMPTTEYNSNQDFKVIKMNASNEVVWDKIYQNTADASSSAYPQQMMFNSQNQLIIGFNHVSPRGMGLLVLETSGTVVQSYKLFTSGNTNGKDVMSNSFVINEDDNIIANTRYRASSQLSTYTNSQLITATVINLKPSFSELGTYTFLSNADFVYSTWSFEFATNDSTVLSTNTLLNETNATYNYTTSLNITLTNVTSEVLTIEFD